MEEEYRKPIQVMCNNCEQEFDEDLVEFVDIEEDFMGRDILTFICPGCKQKARSFRLG